MKIPRSAPIVAEFDRLDWAGRRWLIPALTRGQARAIFALDPEDDEAPESPQALEERIAAQVKIAARDSIEIDADDRAMPGTALPVDELTAEEERQLLIAVVNHHRGQDPASAVALASLLKKNAFAAVLAAALGGSRPSIATA